ncbi:hydrogenase 4 subunit B, partial [Rhizobium ruizarguesonis]
MTSVCVLLSCVAALLGTAVLAVSIARSASSTPVIYGASLVFSAIAFVIALAYLATALPAAEASALVLPL